MADTTSFVLVCSVLDRGRADEISRECDLGWPTRQQTEGFPSALAGYSVARRCYDVRQIDEVVSAFSGAAWREPSVAVLVIDDDRNAFSGVITI